MKPLNKPKQFNLLGLEKYIEDLISKCHVRKVDNVTMYSFGGRDIIWVNETEGIVVSSDYDHFIEPILIKYHFVFMDDIITTLDIVKKSNKKNS
jgi:hypothetical protein